MQIDFFTIVSTLFLFYFEKQSQQNRHVISIKVILSNEYRATGINTILIYSDLQSSNPQFCKYDNAIN